MRPVQILALSLLVICTLGFSTANATQPAPKNVPAKIQAKLQRYANKKLTAICNNLVYCEENKKLVRKDGKWFASFSIIDPKTLTTSARPLPKKGEYIALIKYVETVYQSEGTTKAKALSGDFIPVKRRKLTEITRYVKGIWQ